ncbi:MAG: 50S ribosomal protein L23 [Rickettsiaceae bacterium]
MIKYDLIKSPIITEKATILKENGKFVFKVTKNANKLSVKNSLESIFEVKVKKVNIINVKGKQKKFKGRIGFRSDQKKVLVTLEEGYDIDLLAKG